MIEINALSLAYPMPRRETAAALREVNVHFEQGKISVIIGPSGCGKTSLVKIMAGLLKPTSGMVCVAGSPLRGVRKNTALIFQDFGLLPWKTVRANAELPLRLAGLERTGRQKVDALLEKFGLAAFEKAYPRQLSGGMKQRLAIVRALVMEPELLLMDEPFSGLDAVMREESQDFFLSVKKDVQLTVVMVTHSIEEAVYMADTVYVMTGRNPGTISACVPISREDAAFRENSRFQEYCILLRNALKQPGGAQ
jgi:NitT/TauT family transport system ATP-binding protein